MKKLPGGKLGLALLALMGVSFILLVFAKDEPMTNPTIESTYPSGLAALAELLRQDGYNVSLDKRTRPKLENGDLVVAVKMDRFTNPFSRDDPADKTWDTIQGFTDKGGAELLLRLPSSFDQATLGASLGPVSPLAGMPAKEITRSASDDGNAHETGAPTSNDLASPAAAVGKWNTTKIVDVSHALGATNRFIGQGDNAAAMLSYVHMLAPKGANVVFAEAPIGNISEPGPLDALGPWALAGRTQAYLLGLVIVSTLAIRFGSPIKERVYQRSTRDMVDAVSELLRRGGKNQFALEAALDDTYDRFRLGAGAPLGTTRAHLKERMPEDLLGAVERAEGLAAELLPDDSRAGRKRTLPMVQELDRQATAFEGDTRRRRHPVA